MDGQRRSRRAVLRGAAGAAGVGGLAALAGCSDLGPADVLVRNESERDHEVDFHVTDLDTGEIISWLSVTVRAGEDYRLAGTLLRPDERHRVEFRVRVDRGPEHRFEFTYGPGLYTVFEIRVRGVTDVEVEAT